MSALDVYAQDKRSAELCRQMQVNGFAFDRTRAAEISAALRDQEARARDAADAAVNRPIKRTKTGGFSTADLSTAFFRDLGAPVFYRSELTGAASLGVDALKGYAAAKDDRLRALALAVLEWRRARKIRSTYVDSAPIGLDGRVHPTWMNYGTVSGRWSCQGPNLMNLPRRETDPTAATHDGGVRSLYVASPGNVLVSFDKKQLEMRVAAYASGDPIMIAACETTDMHAANAEGIFGDAYRNATDPVAKKAMRTMAKSSGFAIAYLAEAETVWTRIVASWDARQGPPPTLRAVQAMLNRMRRQLPVYYRWQAQGLLEVIKTGYVHSPILGRQRWLGHTPSPPEAANFPIQSGASDVMNDLLPRIVERLPYGALMVAQVHDSGVFDVPRRHAATVRAICEDLSGDPYVIGTSGQALSAVFPIDIDESERWH